jgi:hypothetical protein
MSNNRELLELAAKAAGMEHMRWSGPSGLSRMLDPSRPECTGSIGGFWNPLTDDGDALRLAVKLGVIVDVRHDQEQMEHNCVCYWLLGKGNMPYTREYLREVDGDINAATRRAIVRAAAELGRTA